MPVPQYPPVWFAHPPQGRSFPDLYPSLIVRAADGVWAVVSHRVDPDMVVGPDDSAGVFIGLFSSLVDVLALADADVPDSMLELTSQRQLPSGAAIGGSQYRARFTTLDGLPCLAVVWQFTPYGVGVVVADGHAYAALWPSSETNLPGLSTRP